MHIPCRQSKSGAGVYRFQAITAWELECTNLEPRSDLDVERGKNFQSRQILNQDKSQGKLLHNGFDRLLWYPSVLAAVNIAFKACLHQRDLLQTLLYSQGAHTVWMAYPPVYLHCRVLTCVSKQKIVLTFLYLKACLCPNQEAEIIFWQSCLTKHKIDNEKSFAESFL